MTLTKHQVMVFGPKEYEDNHGTKFRIIATVRFDDRCNNGHNTFSITGEVKECRKNGYWREYCCGCIHDDIAHHFPELANLIKWHLCSTDGPLHYVDNTLYHALEHGRNLDHARSSAVWPDATDAELLAPNLKERLQARLPQLMIDFRKAVESLGFTW